MKGVSLFIIALIYVMVGGDVGAGYSSQEGGSLLQGEESKSLPGSAPILKTEESNPLPIAFYLIFLPPRTINGPDVSGITETTAVLSVTLNTNGTGHYLLRSAHDPVPTVAEVLAGGSFPVTSSVPATENITGLSSSTSYTLYFVAKSSSGRVQQTVQSVDFTTSDVASYTVTPSAGSHGTITPATAQTVNHGSTTQFTVTPDTGYTASVGGTCGGTLVGTTYTTYAITGNCTVEASFNDCNGDAGGTAYTDNCGVCVGGNTGQTACAADCNGVYSGSAALDNCGICVGGNTGRVSVCRMLNDTGLTWGGSYPSGNNPGCTGEEIGAQDCSNGADADSALNDPSDGHAGFSFTKISNSGAELASTATLGSGADDWACTRDNVTGLIWEVKTSDGGLRDQNDTYFWYNTDPNTNGGAVGYDNPGATCEGYVAGQPATYCNTQAFTARVNAVGLCGQSDWRMPTVKELEGIVSFDRVGPAIDTTYFPNTPASSVVWSGSPYAGHSDGAWFVHFNYGYSGFNYTNNYYQVRLVRGGQCPFAFLTS